MGLFQKIKDSMPKEKTPEELEKHYEAMDNLEKGDVPAMIIAALITFLPVALLIIGVFYGILFLFTL